MEELEIFYEDLLSWLLYGDLRPPDQNKFFIIENELGQANLNILKVPTFMKMDTASKIYFIGHVVRIFKNDHGE